MSELYNLGNESDAFNKHCTMKSGYSSKKLTSKGSFFLSITLMVTVIGFSMIACGGGGNIIPNGIYCNRGSMAHVLTFSENNVELNVYSSSLCIGLLSSQNGTYEIISDGGKNYIHFYWNNGKVEKGIFNCKGKTLNLEGVDFLRGEYIKEQ